ncbi:MAG: ATP-dependent DNA helicase RecG, partial [Candidatus Omnitrophica bacterium]|nr:ATP-dependent DNA helicase RecG [Candidatus Omnitrophota bacterium]
RYSGRLQMVSPEFEILAEGRDELLNMGRIVPIYSLPQGLSQRLLRRLIKQSLDEYLPKVLDVLVYSLCARHNLFNLAKALLNIHFPESPEFQKEAFRRLSFEEFFLFQIPLVLRKLQRKETPGIRHRVEGKLIAEFINNLPFQLTRSQEKVILEIKGDMSSSFVMQRLLQGDVGSGKTVVAVIAGLIAVQGGFQTAFMVPTEILARQHYDKINSVFKSKPQGLGRVRVGLLSGGLQDKEKKRLCVQIANGQIDLVIGTHSLLEENVRFKKLGLVVIDEQHKFGVGQRALLPSKGIKPDVLIMTATPIPRTLAITIYGDLDVSIIKELPPGRGITMTMLFTHTAKSEVYFLIKKKLKKGEQVYVVYPVIEESFALDISGAKKMYEELKNKEFKGYRLGLIHGRMTDKAQQDTMRRFKSRELDLLVSTTVLEVGIDIPNATCMVIEYADRFGLSQLHQLRGRIGRGKEESLCILISDTQRPEALKRLEAMVKYTDGFRIAEEDLKIRGPGEFFGKRQHGLAELKIANPLTQMQLLKAAREEAVRLMDTDRYLSGRQNILLKEKLLQRFPGYEKLIVT